MESATDAQELVTFRCREDVTEGFSRTWVRKADCLALRADRPIRIAAPVFKKTDERCLSLQTESKQDDTEVFLHDGPPRERCDGKKLLKKRR